MKINLKTSFIRFLFEKFSDFPQIQQPRTSKNSKQTLENKMELETLHKSAGKSN